MLGPMEKGLVVNVTADLAAFFLKLTCSVVEVVIYFEINCFLSLVLSQAIVMVLESKGDTTLQMILKLLKSLFDSSVITLDQMRRVQCHLLVTFVFLCSYQPKNT